jgi:TPR repeat protein
MSPRLTAICAIVVVSGVFALGVCLAAERPLAELVAECEAGATRSCAAVALRYRHGDEAPRDLKAALRYFEKACEGGLSFACGYAGDMLYRGLGGEPAREAGIALMRQACGEGDGWSCAQLRRHGVAEPGEARESP